MSPKSATTARAFYTPKLGNVLIAVGGSGTVRAVRRTEDTCNAVSAGCLFSRPIGSTVELAAVPAAGGSFGGWGGACAGVSGQVCRVLVHKGARQVSAAFATTPLGPGNQQQLTVQAASIAAVSSSIPGFSCPGEQQCTTSVPTGTLVELLPDKQSYAIASTWSGGCTGYGYTCGLVVDGPVTVKSVVGALAPPHPKSIGLQVNVVGQGTVTDASHQITKCTAASTYSPACKASYSWDSPVHLTAHHGPGYVFSVWHSSASTLCRGKQPSCATKAKGGGDAVAAIFKRSR
ncbi:MAG TPA: hypothetical protein VKB43_08630 [Gaiellaceae bacterium]|nr:hypothetical protein [Gaiellaceae bacterium]